MSATDFPGFSFQKLIHKAEQLNKPNSILLFADPGKGKTWLSASISAVEGYEKVLLIDVEGGASAIARDWKNVDVINVRSHEGFVKVIEELLENPDYYNAVIIDTIGVVMDRAEKFFGEKPENKNNKFGRWGDLKNWANQVFRDLHNAPFTTIIVAHALDEKDESTGAVKTTAMLPGSFKGTLPGIPDIVGYLVIEATEDGPQRVLIAGNSDKLVTKNRFNLPPKIYQPTMEKIFNHINQGGND